MTPRPPAQSHVEEFSTSNFLGVTADGTLVTPTSESILPSCTKAVVLQLAADLGIRVEQRPIHWDEVATLKEVRPPPASASRRARPHAPY